jgi:hypothetical protein
MHESVTQTEVPAGRKPRSARPPRTDGAPARPFYSTPWLKLRPGPEDPDPELPQLTPTGATRRLFVDLLAAACRELYGNALPVASTEPE